MPCTNQILKTWTTEVRNAEHTHEEDEVPDASAATRKKDKAAELIARIDAATRSGNILVLYSIVLLNPLL